MKTYRIFVQQTEGGFGDMRKAQFDDDGAAVRFGQDLLQSHAAVDIWADGRRIALMSTPYPRIAQRGAQGG